MAARAAQTPGKPRRPALTSLDSTAYEILGVEWNKSGLDSYETLWSRDAALQDVVLPTTFTADKLISAIGKSIKTLVEKIETIWKRVEVADKPSGGWKRLLIQQIFGCWN